MATSAKNVVLVVDDELEIRRMATQALAEIGFTAEVAEDGKDGMRCFMRHRSEISLVLADVIMPVMDGLRMAEKILEIDPEMKILFMTGYSEAQLQVLSRTRFPVLRKPFLPVDLGLRVREMLEPTRRLQGSVRA